MLRKIYLNLYFAQICFTREQQLAADLAQQGIAESDYPQYGKSFKGKQKSPRLRAFLS